MSHESKAFDAVDLTQYLSCMSLRDYFAAQALPIAYQIFTAGETGRLRLDRFVAEAAYELADAMLAAREKKPEVA